MDQICCVKQILDKIQSYQAENYFPPDSLLVLLGPTASGKTALAVELAKILDAEIISADSRQIFKGMDIGTGKDIDTYENIPYHLINIKEAGEKYNVAEFRKDFFEAYDKIIARGKQVILCGGSASYIHSLLVARPYNQIPTSTDYATLMEPYSKEQLVKEINKKIIPPDLKIDFNSKKRIIRSLEIIDYLEKNSSYLLKDPFIIKNYLIFGLNPPTLERRKKISRRLYQRIEEGLIAEVENLVKQGVSYDDLIFYGLEYKYVSYLLQELISYEEFLKKLETEIHRYAKRQMTFFRKMEKDGLHIHWLTT